MLSRVVMCRWRGWWRGYWCRRGRLRGADVVGLIIFWSLCFCLPYLLWSVAATVGDGARSGASWFCLEPAVSVVSLLDRGLLIRCRCWRWGHCGWWRCGWCYCWRVRVNGGCGRWFVTLIWVTEDKDLLWLRSCGLLKAVNRFVLVSWLWSLAVIGVDVESSIALWDWCAGLLGGGSAAVIGWCVAAKNLCRWWWTMFFFFVIKIVCFF
jgi:hypothetical protein